MKQQQRHIQSLSLFETIFLGEDVDGRLWKHSTRASSERQARFRRHVLFIPWEKYLAETRLASFDHTHSHVYSAPPEAMHPRISASLRLSGSAHLSPWNSHCANWRTWTPPVVITEPNVKTRPDRAAAHHSIDKARISFSCLSFIFN